MANINEGCLRALDEKANSVQQSVENLLKIIEMTKRMMVLRTQDMILTQIEIKPEPVEIKTEQREGRQELHGVK